MSPKQLQDFKCYSDVGELSYFFTSYAKSCVKVHRIAPCLPIGFDVKGKALAFDFDLAYIYRTKNYTHGKIVRMRSVHRIFRCSVNTTKCKFTTFSNLSGCSFMFGPFWKLISRFFLRKKYNTNVSIFNMFLLVS